MREHWNEGNLRKICGFDNFNYQHSGKEVYFPKNGGNQRGHIYFLQAKEVMDPPFNLFVALTCIFSSSGCVAVFI